MKTILLTLSVLLILSSSAIATEVCDKLEKDIKTQGQACKDFKKLAKAKLDYGYSLLSAMKSLRNKSENEMQNMYDLKAKIKANEASYTQQIDEQCAKPLEIAKYHASKCDSTLTCEDQGSKTTLILEIDKETVIKTYSSYFDCLKDID
jgi:hypothetical protein